MGSFIQEKDLNSFNFPFYLNEINSRTFEGKWIHLVYTLSYPSKLSIFEKILEFCFTPLGIKYCYTVATNFIRIDLCLRLGK